MARLHIDSNQKRGLVHQALARQDASDWLRFALVHLIERMPDVDALRRLLLQGGYKGTDYYDVRVLTQPTPIALLAGMGDDPEDRTPEQVHLSPADWPLDRPVPAGYLVVDSYPPPCDESFIGIASPAEVLAQIDEVIVAILDRQALSSCKDQAELRAWRQQIAAKQF